jgi:hypothetical protein
VALLRSALPWLCLALMLAGQYEMFRQYARREVTWCFPLIFDQTVYLGRAYACYERILEDGPLQGVISALERDVPNGLVLEAEAGLLSLALGPSRLTALTVNFLHFALLQLVLVATLRWYAGRWSPGFLALGLLLAAVTPFNLAGGLFDFRLDFAAFCLYGVFLCAVLRSRVFASYRWSLVVGAAGAWLVLTRYLTAVYLAGFLAGILGLLAVALIRGDSAWRRQVGRRIAGLFLSGLTLAAPTLPVVFWKWPLIRSYYLGHLGTIDCAVRGEEFGAVGPLGRLVFYVKSVVLDHAGSRLLVLAGLVLAAAGVAALVLRRRARPQPVLPCTPAVVCAALCLLVPLGALTLFGSPSPVVGNVMVLPLLLLVLLPVLAVLPQGARAGQVATILAVLVLAAGSYCQAHWFRRPRMSVQDRIEMEAVTQLYERIGDCCRQHGWTRPRVAFGTTSGSLLPTLITPVVYERQGNLLEVQAMLGGGVNPISEDSAVESILGSDIVVMPLSDQGPTLIYPFVQCMCRYRPRLLALCRRSFIEVGRFRLPGTVVLLFVRPASEGKDHSGQRALN